MIGAFLFIIYGFILLFVYRKTRPESASANDGLILLNRGLPSRILIPGVFNSWLWTTSVIGAAEASVVYGFYGGISFAIGTGIGALLMIFALLRFRRLMGDRIFITDFIEARFCEKTAALFYAASVLLVVYIIIEQAVGMSSVFAALFGVSFKKAAFFSIILAMAFVVFTGIRGVVFNDIISFALICLLMLFIVHTICARYNAGSIINSVYTADYNTARLNNTLPHMAAACARYGVSSMIIGFSQLILDPGYQIRAHAAKDASTVKLSFVSGIIALWIPFVILSSLLFGYLLFGFGLETLDGANFSVTISRMLFLHRFGPAMKYAFAFMLLIIAFTTIINCIMGIMGMCVIKIYPLYANSSASKSQSIKYGRLLTALIALFCALISISLENISLLTIDIFSGIFFSAPAGILLCGIYGKKSYGSLAVQAFILGVTLGFGVWLAVKDRSMDWFLATAISFIAPIIFLTTASAASGKGDFNFTSLKFYKFTR